MLNRPEQHFELMNLVLKKIDSLAALKKQLILAREKLSAIQDSKESEIQREHQELIESLKTK